MPSRYTTPTKIIKPLPEGLEFRDGRFWKKCDDCGTPQSYRRRDHAIQLLRKGSVCGSCGARKRGGVFTGKHRGVSVSYFENKRKDAVARGHTFDLTIDDVADLLEAQEFKCALTGEPVLLDKSNFNSGSIDRIDNDKGYTKENIHIVTKEINMLRGSFSLPEFKRLCALVSS